MSERGRRLRDALRAWLVLICNDPMRRRRAAPYTESGEWAP